MECFYEQFQTKDYKKIEKTISILSKVVIVFGVLCGVLLNLIGLIFFALVYLGIFILSRNIILEYEYELTGNELSINKIMNKSKRKEIGNLNIKEISSVKDINQVSSNTKLIKAYLEESEYKPMVYVTKTSKGVVGFQLAMDDNLLSLIKRVNPLAFY